MTPIKAYTKGKSPAIDFDQASEEINGLLSPEHLRELRNLVQAMRAQGYKAVMVPPPPGATKITHIAVDFIPPHENN